MENKKFLNVRWMLVLYDILIFILADLMLFVFYDPLSWSVVLEHAFLALFCIMLCRGIGKVYRQVWRYGGIQCYIRLLITDGFAFFLYFILSVILNISDITVARMLSLVCMNLLGCLAIRMIYRYAFKCGNKQTAAGRFLCALLKLFAGIEVDEVSDTSKIKVAVIGAGSVGVSLAEELNNNSAANYIVRCFIDLDREKVGKDIKGLPVLSESEESLTKLRELGIQEVIFAIPSMDMDKKKNLYNFYKSSGFKVKVYDFPTFQTAGKKRHLREFDIEELLFRKPLEVFDERTYAYYRDKVVLITGGGGSIGSELCRQLAKMSPKQIVILDIYENGVYDVQQELKIAYAGKIDLRVEICSITNRKGMARVFETYHPEIVINAAAHKHVPLMEHNCI